MGKPLHHLLKLYANNPKLQGGFGQSFGQGLIATDKFEHNPKKAYYEYTFLPSHVNIQETCHGGALATMVDVATTVSILRMSLQRTISISLNTEFLNVIRLGEKVGIETEITKMGNKVVFTDCRIYTGVDGGSHKLACRGSHIKAILDDQWDFTVDKS